MSNDCSVIELKTNSLKDLEESLPLYSYREKKFSPIQSFQIVCHLLNIIKSKSIVEFKSNLSFLGPNSSTFFWLNQTDVDSIFLVLNEISYESNQNIKANWANKRLHFRDYDEFKFNADQIDLLYLDFYTDIHDPQVDQYFKVFDQSNYPKLLLINNLNSNNFLDKKQVVIEALSKGYQILYTGGQTLFIRRDIYLSHNLENFNTYSYFNQICESAHCSCVSASIKNKKNHSLEFINNQLNYIYYDTLSPANTFIKKTLFPGSYLDIKDKPCKWSTKQTKDPNKNYFSFAFTLNPWRKIVLNWFSSFDPNSDIGSLLRTANPNYENARTLYDFIKTISKINTHHFVPQHVFFPENVSFLGKMENFHNDFDFVCDKISVRNSKRYKCPKNELKKDYASFFDAKTVSIFEDKYHKDIDLLGYQFGD